MPEPVLSVVVPVFDEEAHLEAVLARLFATPCPIAREWIFVDDASSDGSPAILDALRDRADVTVIHRAVNGGKGAALRAGFAAARGDFVMVQDADMEYDPADVPRLLQPLIDDQADVVFGSRFRADRVQVHRTFHYLGNRVLTDLSNLASGIYLSDMETCYKVFRADLLKAMQLRSERFGFEVECTAYVAKTAARIYELPISYTPRTRLAGKKIGWRDGVAALWHIVRFNLLVSRTAAFGRALPARYEPQH
jgi:glycosyltransferase involved in cell wall biosynthesis